MKTIAVVASAVILSCAASYVLCKNVGSSRAESPVNNESGAALESLSGEVRELRASSSALRGDLDALRAQLSTRDAGAARVPLADIEDAVARALAARKDATSALATNAAPAAPAAKKRTPKQVFDELVTIGGDWEAAQKLWASLREDGQVADVLALFEQRAKDHANDPTAQVDLGRAFLQKLFTVPAGPEQGAWAMKADKAFDTALALDDHHWGARFNKAISLSNWPAFMGKQGEAAKQFETLLEQQKSVPSRPEHAETYFFLGNLYQSMGKTDQALSTWRAGLELFPDNTRLAGQISAAPAH